MTEKVLSTVRETVYESITASGLRISVIPKPGFAKKHVAVSFAFGSLNRRFRHSVTGEIKTLPSGVQHFLEHMLFESAEADISEQFARLGASVNAYTSQERTVYYFTTSGDIELAAKPLIDLCFRPAYDETHVNKEREIIRQELRMYEDDPNQRIYQETIQNLFAEHALKDEILGDDASLTSISKTSLDEAYGIGYSMNNAIITVVGDVNPQETIRFFESILATYHERTTPFFLEKCDEPQMIVKAHQKQKKDIATDLVMIGFKLLPNAPLNALDSALFEFTFSFLADQLIGKKTANYRHMMENRLINDEFDYEVNFVGDVGVFCVFFETHRAEKAIVEIQRILMETSSFSLNLETFAATRNRLVGSYITMFNRIDDIANLFIGYQTKRIDVDQLLEEAMKIAPADLLALLPLFNRNKMTVVRFHP